tara:strand:+ start:1276 stop:1845 length:570 start_codon:yes stop_codon:yes gene_type:complete
MDNHIMERIFSNEHSLSYLPSYSEYASEETYAKIDKVIEHMSRINPIEADMVELHLLKGVPQSALGKIFGYTQPNIHYRVNRALDRIKILMQVPIFEEDELLKTLSQYFSDTKDIKVMVLLYLYSSQSHAARVIGESQGKVRYRFLRCLNAMKKIESLQEIHLALDTINSNLTLLRKSEKIEEPRRVIL